MVQLNRFALAVIPLLAFAASCDRLHGASDDAGADASGVDVAVVVVPEEPDTPATWSEARRARLTAAQIANEPGLAKNEAALRAHFGGTFPGAMELQAVPLANGRQHLLLQSMADDPKPIALLVDAEGAAIWTRERPTGGITPPVRALTLTPRPDNGVALFFWDEPTRLLAARMWNAEGAPFADLQIAQAVQVDAIAAAWWKGRGWLVVASMPGGARGHFLRESGTPSWSEGGVAVGLPSKASRPTAIALDSDVTWMLVQRATKSGADRVLAFRYDTRGEPVWKRPIDLGPSSPSKANDRIEGARAREGVARFAFDGRTVEIRSDGSLL